MSETKQETIPAPPSLRPVDDHRITLQWALRMDHLGRPSPPRDYLQDFSFLPQDQVLLPPGPPQDRNSQRQDLLQVLEWAQHLMSEDDDDEADEVNTAAGHSRPGLNQGSGSQDVHHEQGFPGQ
mmetsp:Transcript_10184/g.22679  ORF Transcript_10184/g.22679 Transcript_10184/m.22679 type:complete len:124 (+) Transcript_10184:82-453(+)